MQQILKAGLELKHGIQAMLNEREACFKGTSENHILNLKKWHLTTSF